MFVFLVQVAVIASTAYSYQLGEPGLHFDEHGEYAATYDDYKPRDYQFGYEVSDPHTGDHKSHWEIRENGVVRGSYSLLEPDGTTRVVDYIADKHGFRAVVKKIGTAIHPEPVEHHGIGYGEGIQTHAEPIILQQEVEPIYHSSYDGRIDNYGNDYLLPEKYLNILERVETPHKIEPTLEIADIPIYSIPEKVEVIQQPTIEISHTPVYSSPEVSHVGLLESGHVGLAQPQQIVVQPQIPQAVSVIKQPILTKLSEWYRKWARPYAKGIAVAPVLAKPPETNQKWSYGSGQNENTAIWAKQPEIYQKWAAPYKPVEITKWAEVPEPAVKWEGQGEAEVVLTKIPEVYQKWAVPYGVGNGEVEKWSAPYGGEAKSVHLETKIEPHVEESSQIHGLTGNLEDDSKYKNYGEGGYGGGWKTRLPYEYVINHPVLK